jgi:hypothetical protein
MGGVLLRRRRIALDAKILSIKIGMIPVKAGSAEICPIAILLLADCTPALT